MRTLSIIFWAMFLALAHGAWAELSLTISSANTSVIYPGQSSNLSLRIDNRNQAALSNVQLECYLTSFWGERIPASNRTVSITANAVQIYTITVPCSRVGYWAVGLRVLEGAQIKADNPAAWSLAVLDQERTFPADSPLGTYMIGNTGLLASIVPKGFYSDMSKMGARWGTMDIWWSLLEPSNGQYHWEYYDQWFEKMRQAGITPIPHLYATPQWATSYVPGQVGDYWEYPPADMNQWRQFVRDFVTRYKDWLTYLRIWNEPNVGFWRGTPAQYAQLVIAASQEAKAVKPELKIIIEAVDDVYQYQNVLPFFDALHNAGATPHWDVIAIHNYWLNNADPPENTSYAQRYQLLTSWRNSHKPEGEVWDTEFGCMSETWGNGFWIGVGETKQAQWLARAHAIGFSKSLKKMIWFPGYCWPDETMAPYYNPAGLLRANLSPKPAYVAYRAVAVALSEATYDSELAGLSTGQYGMIFKRPDGYVTLLWSKGAEYAKSIYLGYSGDSELTLMDLMGVSKPLALSEQKKAHVAISESMQYVFSKSKPVVTYSSAKSNWVIYS